MFWSVHILIWQTHLHVEDVSSVIVKCWWYNMWRSSCMHTCNECKSWNVKIAISLVDQWSLCMINHVNIISWSNLLQQSHQWWSHDFCEESRLSVDSKWSLSHETSCDANLQLINCSMTNFINSDHDACWLWKNVWSNMSDWHQWWFHQQWSSSEQSYQWLS